MEGVFILGFFVMGVLVLKWIIINILVVVFRIKDDSGKVVVKIV